jgi:hypothetical protein
MILHDHWCKYCGTSFEAMVEWDERETTCPGCNGRAERYYKSGCANTMPVDAAWLKTLVDVVDKDPTKPHCVEFLKSQTRDNYERWKKCENLRHLEPGERPSRPEPFDVDRHAEKVAELRQQRNRIEVR